MVNEAHPHIDFLLKLSLANFGYHMKQEFLAHSFFRRLICNASGMKEIHQIKLLKILDFLNLVGDNYRYLFVHVLFKMPGFAEACEDPLFRHKLLQKLIPNLANTGGSAPRTLEQIELQYRDSLNHGPSTVAAITLADDYHRWLEGDRRYKQSMLEGIPEVIQANLQLEKRPVLRPGLSSTSVGTPSSGFLEPPSQDDVKWGLDRGYHRLGVGSDDASSSVYSESVHPEGCTPSSLPPGESTSPTSPEVEPDAEEAVEEAPEDAGSAAESLKTSL
jgi:hypothetical protein